MLARSVQPRQGLAQIEKPPLRADELIHRICHFTPSSGQARGVTQQNKTMTALAKGNPRHLHLQTACHDREMVHLKSEPRHPDKMQGDVKGKLSRIDRVTSRLHFVQMRLPERSRGSNLCRCGLHMKCRGLHAKCHGYDVHTPILLPDIVHRFVMSRITFKMSRIAFGRACLLVRTPVRTLRMLRIASWMSRIARVNDVNPFVTACLHLHSPWHLPSIVE